MFIFEIEAVFCSDLSSLTAPKLKTTNFGGLLIFYSPLLCLLCILFQLENP
jgi:hypothetical protein